MQAPFNSFEEMWEGVGEKLRADCQFNPEVMARVVWLYSRAAAIVEAGEISTSVFNEAREKLAGSAQKGASHAE